VCGNWVLKCKMCCMMVSVLLSLSHSSVISLATSIGEVCCKPFAVVAARCHTLPWTIACISTLPLVTKYPVTLGQVGKQCLRIGQGTQRSLPSESPRRSLHFRELVRHSFADQVQDCLVGELVGSIDGAARVRVHTCASSLNTFEG